MSKVIATGSSVAVFFYIMVGVFGYALFAYDTETLGQLCLQNILLAPDLKDSVPFKVANFALLLSVICAAPLCVLPAKDTVEELFFKPKMTNC